MAFRRPTILTLILGAGCLATLLALGFWQLDRLAWKNALLAEVQERLDHLPDPLPKPILPEWEYRPVSVVGSVIPNSWFHFPARTVNGEVGDVLMLLISQDDGRVIPLEHSVIAFGASLPPLPSAIAREGVLRRPAVPGFFTPDNNLVANQWYSVDTSAMYTAAGVGQGGVDGYYVVARDWQPNFANNHLQYAITWLSLAGVFVVIFVLFHRKKKPTSAPLKSAQ